MTTTDTDDTPPPGAGQRPENLHEAIGLLSAYPAFASLEVPHLQDFVVDLIETYPHLVLREIVTRRSDYIGKVLGSYRGEV